MADQEPWPVMQMRRNRRMYGCSIYMCVYTFPKTKHMISRVQSICTGKNIDDLKCTLSFLFLQTAPPISHLIRLQIKKRNYPSRKSGYLISAIGHWPGFDPEPSQHFRSLFLLPLLLIFSFWVIRHLAIEGSDKRTYVHTYVSAERRNSKPSFYTSLHIAQAQILNVQSTYKQIFRGSYNTHIDLHICMVLTYPHILCVCVHAQNSTRFGGENPEEKKDCWTICECMNCSLSYEAAQSLKTAGKTSSEIHAYSQNKALLSFAGEIISNSGIVECKCI